MPDLFTNPPAVTSSASPFNTVDAGVPRFFGPHRRSGAIWAAGFAFGGTYSQLINIIKSADNGNTWSVQNAAGAPSDIDEGFGYVDFVFDGATIHALGRRSGPEMSYVSFDMGAGTGAFGSPIYSGLANGFWKIAVYNGNPIAIYSDFSGGTSVGKALRYSVISSGSFGAPVDIEAGVANHFWAPLGTILDASGTLHILYQKNKTSGAGATTEIWYNSLSSGGSLGSPVLVDTAVSSAWPAPTNVGIGAIWNDGVNDRILWGILTPDDRKKVYLYDGSPASGPTFTKRLVATHPFNAAAQAFVVHVIVSGGVPYLWWYFTDFGTYSQVQYCTFDGSTFSAPLVAWDAIANRAPLDPGDANIDAFSVAANGSGWDLMADEPVTAGYDYALVFLTNVAPPTSRGPRNDFF